MSDPDAIEVAKSIFDTASKMIEVLEASNVSDGPQKAAVIKVIAVTYGMKAKPDRNS